MREQLGWITTIVRANRRGIGLALAFTVVAATVEVVSIGMYYPILASLTGAPLGEGIASRFLAPLGRVLGTPPRLLPILGLLVGLLAVRAGCLYAARIISNHYEMMLNLRLKRDFLRRLGGTTWEFTLKAEPGSLLNLFSQYTTSTSRALFYLVEFLIDAVSCLAYLSFAVYVSPFFALFVVAAGLVAGPLLRRIYWRIKLLVEENIRLQNALANQFLDYFQGLKTFKSMSLEEPYLRALDRDVQRFTDNERRSYRVQAALNVLGEPMFSVIGALFLLVAHYGFAVGMETVVIFFALLSKTYTRLNSLQSNAGRLVRNAASIRTVESFERQAVAAAERTGGRPLPGPITSVDLDGVSFAYPDGTVVFDRTSLRLDVGRGLIAIAGASGGGKSTLLDLLSGLLTPTAGAIRINGVDVRDLDMRSLRSRVGFVPQRPVLFRRTILENISLRERSETDLAAVEEAARLADAHEFVGRLHRGYETLMGEEGASLSVGQIQRLSIARALYQQPEVLFFDEPTSALDRVAAAEVMRVIERIALKYPVFLITHSLDVQRGAPTLLLVEGREVRVVEATEVAEGKERRP
jgi:ATP-binding cassette, subfamily B, bacterial